MATRTDSKTDTTTDRRNQALKPVLAGVGVTDLAVEVVRDAVADVQKRLVSAQKDVTARAAAAKDARVRRSAIEARVSALQTEAKAYPARVQTQVTSLVDDNVAAATATYAGLVKRGESLVGRIRRQDSTVAATQSAGTTVAKAKTTATQARKAADASATAADRTAATKVAPKPRPTAKKATQKAAGKKAAATTARKSAAKKTATAQSSAKATATAARTTAAHAAQAVVEAAEKVGD